MSEEKKKRYYYYEDKEKKASQVRKESQESKIVPYTFGDVQRDFDKMMERFEREFEDAWGYPPRWRRGMRWMPKFPMMPFKEATMPSVDIEDRGKDFRLAVDLPGFKKEDLEIEVADDALIISAKRSLTEEEKKKNYVRRERTSEAFYRRVQLPERVKSDDAKAALNNGVLEIILPKKEPRETKKLTIA